MSPSSCEKWYWTTAKIVDFEPAIDRFQQVRPVHCPRYAEIDMTSEAPAAAFSVLVVPSPSAASRNIRSYSVRGFVFSCPRPALRAPWRLRASSRIFDPKEMSTTWSSISASVTSSSVARNDWIRVVGRFEIKPTVSDNRTFRREGRSSTRIVGSSVANIRLSAITLAEVSALKRG